MKITEIIFHFIHCHNLKIKLVEKLVTSTEYELIEITKICDWKIIFWILTIKILLYIKMSFKYYNKPRLDVDYFADIYL